MPNSKQILIDTLWSLAMDEHGGNEIWSALKAMGVEVPTFVDDYKLVARFLECELGARYCDGEPVATAEDLREWQQTKAEYEDG